MAKYFADTYAIIEFIKGNEHYKKYFIEGEIVTTKLNLMELYYAALLESSEELAEEYYESFLAKAVEIDDETVKGAMRLRYSLRTRKLSYADSIGYHLSLEKGIKFLTGDNPFRGLKNVEFVK